MKREYLLTAFWAFLLSSLLAVGGVGCLTTAFDIRFPVEILRILLLSCALFGLWWSLPQGKWLAAAALALIVGHFWRTWHLPLQFESLVWRISGFYDSAYGCGTLSWSGENLSDVPVDNALIAIGCLVGLISAATVCAGCSSIPALAVSILPLAACVVVTDTVPDSKYLFALMLGFLLLLMPQSLRRRSRAGGNRLTALVAAPLILALALLFQLIPREGYTPPPEDLPDRILAWFEDLGSEAERVADTFTGQEADETVNLRAVGPKLKRRNTVMEVTAAQDGPLYLRGQAYDTYDGKSWSKSEGTWVEDNDYQNLNNVGTIHIVTTAAHDVFYTPYNMGSPYLSQMKQGRISNPDGKQDYDMDQWKPDTILESSALTLFATSCPDMSQYLQLPDQTREEALEYLSTNWTSMIPAGGNPVYSILEEGLTPLTWPCYDLTLDGAVYYLLMANCIADYVRASASYSLRTGRMPAGEADFAMWFLNDSDTGYCVHFATATAVLLRAAGIPARYVTGYLADGVAGEAVTVLGGDAHAWVEYWLPGYGWQILESTAASETSPVATTIPTETTEPQPVDTTAPTGTEPDQTQPTPSQPDPSQPDPTQTDPPAGNGDQDPGQKEPPDLSGLWKAIKWLFGIAAATALVFGQRLARLRWRETRRCRGSAKEQALYRWRETEWISRVLKQTPPESLWELARKAKFSQYQLLSEELAQFDAFRAEAVARMQEKQWYWQVLYRLVLALY